MPSVTGERLAWELQGGDGGARQGQETWRQHRVGEERNGWWWWWGAGGERAGGVCLSEPSVR